MSVFIHESSYVDDGAQVGAGTKIWHFCHVMPGAVIGERCNLGQNVVVMGGTKLGNNVKVQNNVSIYEGVELEDDVFCGPSMVFTNVMNPRSHVSRYAVVTGVPARRTGWACQCGEMLRVGGRGPGGGVATRDPQPIQVTCDACGTRYVLEDD